MSAPPTVHPQAHCKEVQCEGTIGEIGERTGLSKWHIEQALGCGVALLLGAQDGDGTRRWVVGTCVVCGARFAGLRGQKCCSLACSSALARAAQQRAPDARG